MLGPLLLLLPPRRCESARPSPAGHRPAAASLGGPARPGPQPRASAAASRQPLEGARGRAGVVLQRPLPAAAAAAAVVRGEAR